MTCSRSQRSDCSPLLFLFCFSPPNALFFVTDHTTKLGMKDLLKAQQWRVGRDSNLIPPQYRTNALTATPCSPYKFQTVENKTSWWQNFSRFPDANRSYEGYQADEKMFGFFLIISLWLIVQKYFGEKRPFVCPFHAELVSSICGIYSAGFRGVLNGRRRRRRRFN